MRERLHALVEKYLPWYDEVEARQHDARSERIHARNIRARLQAEAERQRVAVAIRNTVDAVSRR